MGNKNISIIIIVLLALVLIVLVIWVYDQRIKDVEFKQKESSNSALPI